MHRAPATAIQPNAAISRRLIRLAVGSAAELGESALLSPWFVSRATATVRRSVDRRVRSRLFTIPHDAAQRAKPKLKIHAKTVRDSLRPTLCLNLPLATSQNRTCSSPVVTNVAPSGESPKYRSPSPEADRSSSCVILRSSFLLSTS